MGKLKLFMVLVGCRPKGRFTEQHDVFFGIGKSLKEIVPHINAFWPEAKGKVHIDAWREIKQVNGFKIEINSSAPLIKSKHHLFFINLGGYKQGEFDEFHYKMLAVATTSTRAISQSKKTLFYKTTGFKEAPSHVDDKYSLDVDDIYNIKDILSPVFKDKYHITIFEKEGKEDNIHLGYLPLSKI